MAAIARRRIQYSVDAGIAATAIALRLRYLFPKVSIAVPQSGNSCFAVPLFCCCFSRLERTTILQTLKAIRCGAFGELLFILLLTILSVLPILLFMVLSVLLAVLFPVPQYHYDCIYYIQS